LYGNQSPWALRFISTLKQQDLLLGETRAPLELMEAGYVDDKGGFHPSGLIEKYPQAGSGCPRGAGIEPLNHFAAFRCFCIRPLKSGFPAGAYTGNISEIPAS